MPQYFPAPRRDLPVFGESEVTSAGFSPEPIYKAEKKSDEALERERAKFLASGFKAEGGTGAFDRWFKGPTNY